ncbi:CG12655 [Drosophila busckii]|uniref:CG12655 n=1 Tax=Drosophila busckii TaxID=30019 RepID=A0A0M3QZB1_DROBS|nr:protein argonaute 2 [Drosophila busckii]ALC49113.1 CG12655 [Drosophila busckii]
MFVSRRCSCFVLFWICLLSVVCAQGNNWPPATDGRWAGGANGQVGAGAVANAGMHPPGQLGSTDPQFSYGYAGVDSRGPYGGAGGNGGYYVSGVDEHGRPYNYNGGAGAAPNYHNSYNYRSGAAVALGSLGLALTLTLLATRA